MDGQMKPAMQWVFKGEDSGEQKFEESCAGKGWIHNIPRYLNFKAVINKSES
jgi:hypothetical protein